MSWQDLGSFTLAEYLRDRLPLVAVWLLCMVAIFIMASVLGVTPWGSFMLCLVVATACCVAVVWDFARKRAYYGELQQAVGQLEKVRHLSAFVDDPGFLEGHLSWEACDTLAYLSGRELAEVSAASDAYERYIETWVHEIKTPIAASRLVLGRLRGPEATALRQELESIERYVEQALYCARSQVLSTDYAVRELSLVEVAKEACKRNQNLLIASGATPVVDIDEEHRVYSDPSWLIFILGQLLSNAAKYGATSIRFSSREQGTGTSGRIQLEVADDGAGIPESDMASIFNQGFVGSNGRAEGSATGMGLYLCAELCRTMGIGIDAYSEEGRGTRMVLTFPVNADSLSVLEQRQGCADREESLQGDCE